MNRLERINAVLAGKKPDRAPICCWYHFGTQYMPGEMYAKIVLSFFHFYGFDWLKVMNDYFYPMPPGLNAVKNASDLKALRPFKLEDSPLGQQLKALEIISKELKGHAYFCDTIFDPFQALEKSLVGEHLHRLIQDEPDAVLAALDVVTDMLIQYADRVLDIGAHGIFVSILADRSLMPRQIFQKFVKPFAFRLFEAVKDKGPMNTLHLHGKDIDLENSLDIPAAVLSWEDRLPTNPSLKEMKERWSGCVMGGIDLNVMTRHTPEFLMQHTREGMALGGNSRFFLTNGCSTPSHMDVDSLKAMVETAQGIR